MPFTPFHMGAGLALKAMAGRHFSVLTFGMAQVAMDIEPLVGMLRGAALLHGPTHTYLGAVPIALATAALAIASSALWAAGTAHAAFPDKPITLVVPTAAGGGNDGMARVVALKLSTLLGQQVIVENKAGANGAIAAEYVARAAPTA